MFCLPMIDFEAEVLKVERDKEIPGVLELTLKEETGEIETGRIPVRDEDKGIITEKEIKTYQGQMEGQKIEYHQRHGRLDGTTYPIKGMAVVYEITILTGEHTGTKYAQAREATTR